MKTLSLILIAALTFPACSHFSKTARQQRAYEKYVRTSMAKQAKQRTKIAKTRAAEMPLSEVSPWTETTSAEGPMSISSGQSDQ